MRVKNISVDAISPFVRYAKYIETNEEIYYVPWRMIYDHEIYYVTKGKIKVMTEEGSVVLSEGDIHVMRPFVRHSRQPLTKEIGYYNLHFDFTCPREEEDISIFSEYLIPLAKHLSVVPENERLVKREVTEPSQIALPLKQAMDQAKCTYLLCHILEHYETPSPSNRILLKADLCTLLAMMQSSCGMADKFCHNAVAQFTQSISEGYSERLFLSDLAVQSGMSASQMRKVFRRVYNCSPRDYLIEMRIERAKYLLEEGKANIATIAAQIGYPNVTYFSRIFRQKVGVSPSEYRKQLYNVNHATVEEKKE